jgi:hypothetical protein
VEGEETAWARLFTPDGDLVPTLAESANQRAEAAEAEVSRLRALLQKP